MYSRYLNGQRITFERADFSPLRLRMLKYPENEYFIFDHVWALLIGLDVWINGWRQSGWMPSAGITIWDHITEPNPRAFAQGILTLRPGEAGCTFGNRDPIVARSEST